MHLDLTPEALLTQLGYTKSEQTLKQINNIIANTKDFEKPLDRGAFLLF